uniref:L1 transposable element RRM domain-containing protein n=1 Tax=Poecilia formosa TaxID=48698 RepID=A0A087YRV6_POEFO
MPRSQREKDFPIFSPPGSSTKKKTVPKEPSQGEANASVSELADQTTMELILSEVKSLASRMKDMDASIGTRLDTIDVALGDLKASVGSVESSLSLLSSRAADLEKRMEEAEGRISGTEDSLGAHGTSIAAMEKIVEQLQLKIDDLENRGRRKNLKIINLPEKVEGNTPLVDFLQEMLPTLVGLPADHPALEIERAHRALAPAPAPNKPPRSILVRFLRYSHREAVLNAAKKKRDIFHGGSQLRFYPDLSAEVLRRRREFGAVVKELIRRDKYRGFAYPARLRCLHEGRIRFFDTSEAAAAFLDSLK